MDKYKIAVIGSRSFTNKNLMKAELLELIKSRGIDEKDVVIISGGAKGADLMAEVIADECGFSKNIMRANWEDLTVPNVRKKINAWNKVYNANAGHDRNLKMAKECDEAIAFWDGVSPGTKNMISNVKMLCKPIKVVRY